ncbi:hypothetical protein [Streptomyces chartreusis]|uniref:hypothetical protein n=1 Tax=Streptomyces chartreusis TaxID=1969 RepID=UPI0033B94294
MEDSPDEALQYVKDEVRQALIKKGAADDLVYAIGIFGHPYRKGDASLVAERVTPLTPPGGDVTGGIVDRRPSIGDGPICE